jgi:hypothetical protein
MSLTVVYKIPGQPERQRYVSALEPGRSTAEPHEFTVPASATEVRVSVRESGDQNLFINESLPVPR